MPYELLANVVSLKTGKPFLANMESFGFVPDASSAANPHGLPIGLTTVHSRNGSHIGLEMVGTARHAEYCRLGPRLCFGRWFMESCKTMNLVPNRGRRPMVRN